MREGRLAETVSVMGLPIRNHTLVKAADDVMQRARQGLRTRVFFVNAHCANVAARDAAYAACLREAEFLFADGRGMRWAAAREGVELADNVNGTDLFPLLCVRAADAGVPIGLLGARPGVAQRCGKAMMRRFPGLRVAWVHDGYWVEREEPAMLDSLNASGARLLFVALGVPRQELWTHASLERLEPSVVLAVGALFDFYSGDVPRAPLWMRQRGLEWCYRLYKEPRRLFVRYVVGNPLFIWRVLRSGKRPTA